MFRLYDRSDSFYPIVNDTHCNISVGLVISWHAFLVGLCLISCIIVLVSLCSNSLSSFIGELAIACASDFTSDYHLRAVGVDFISVSLKGFSRWLY